MPFQDMTAFGGPLIHLGVSENRGSLSNVFLPLYERGPLRTFERSERVVREVQIAQALDPGLRHVAKIQIG